jgi:prepilin-type N-terminal cleavage/methylation domain-containing protein
MLPFHTIRNFPIESKNETSKGFSLIELLVVFVIITILLGLGVDYTLSFIRDRKVEGDVLRIYTLLKEAQINAKITKEEIIGDLINNGQILVLKYGNGTIYNNLTLSVPFKFKDSTKTLKISPLGFFTYGNSIYADIPNRASYNCVKYYFLRICQGKWNSTQRNCICQF